MPRMFLLLVICILAPGYAAVASDGLDGQRDIDQYGHRVWTSQNGVPGEAVYQVVQSADGYLWLRTTAGLVQFDGERFTRMEPTLEGAPFREEVRTISKTREGDLLVRGQSQTIVYRAGRFQTLLPATPLPDGTVRLAVQASDGGLWIGADDFIYHERGGHVEMLRRGTSWITAAVESPGGEMWIGGQRGLYEYAGEKLKLELAPPAGMTALLIDR